MVSTFEDGESYDCCFATDRWLDSVSPHFLFLLSFNFDFFFFLVGRCNDRAKRKGKVRDGGGEEGKERGGEKGEGKRKQRKRSGGEYA